LARTRLIVFTIGHSTRSTRDFVRLLTAHGVKRLIDVRTIPKSRHNPQFGGGRLKISLRRAGIVYRHMPALGGLRKAKAGSTNNAGWRNPSFRGYADYMETPTFRKALLGCIALAKKKPTVLMCAEAVPWRCHRSLIADALVVRGIDAREITSGIRSRSHSLTPFARPKGTQLSYPGLRAQGSRLKAQGSRIKA
jgi:uncharacterized protein (DUF488 family)